MALRCDLEDESGTGILRRGQGTCAQRRAAASLFAARWGILSTHGVSGRRVCGQQQVVFKQADKGRSHEYHSKTALKASKNGNPQDGAGDDGNADEKRGGTPLRAAAAQYLAVGMHGHTDHADKEDEQADIADSADGLDRAAVEIAADQDGFAVTFPSADAVGGAVL
jgi:hypothetical protein